MDYELVLPPSMAAQLKQHLFSDRSREQMCISLCGIHKRNDKVRLLGRHLILFPPDAFSHQGSAGLELKPEVQRIVLQMASSEGLSQIDWHTHPGGGSHVAFSGIDDRYEYQLAEYLHKHIPGTIYGSVVANGDAMDARVWDVGTDHIRAKSMQNIFLEEFNPIIPCSHNQSESRNIFASILSRKFLKSESSNGLNKQPNDHYGRQVIAFGQAFQNRLSHCRIGVVGVGGLGSIMVEELARLGVNRWVLIDPDIIDSTNLNRIPGSALNDVILQKSKVEVIQRNILTINPDSSVVIFDCSVFDQTAHEALCSCDLLIAATDNNSSRLFVNQLAAQYLIPLVHVGVNIGVDAIQNQFSPTITDISGELVIPDYGAWCLQCAAVIDSQVAGWELASPDLRRALRKRGYINDIPAPAVYHLNGTVASMAVAEIHNLIFPYKPLRRYLVYDGRQSEIMPLEIEPHKNCRVCSPEGILALGDLEDVPTFQKFPSESTTVPAALEEERDAVEPETGNEKPEIRKVIVTEGVIREIQANIKDCNEGKLLGVSNPESGIVQIVKARTLACPRGQLQRVGFWGSSISMAPSYPSPYEVFVLMTPEDSSIKVYKVLSQAVVEIENVYVVKDSAISQESAA